MATFTVRFRRVDGRICEEVFEASSRSDVFAKLKNKGITPISVRDGGKVVSVKSKDEPRQQKGRFWMRHAAIAAVVIAGCVVGWLLMAPQATPPKVPVEKPEKPKAVERPAVTNAPKVRHIVRGRKPDVEQKVTANTGPLPPQPLIMPPKYGEINGTNIFPRPLFKTREENMLAGLVSAPPGARVLASGFLPGEEERYRAALDSVVEFEDRDTDEERSLKNFMIGLKEELKAAVAKGEKITDIVQQLRDERNALANYRDKLRMNYFMLKKEGTPEEAEQYRTEANEILKEYGMQPLGDGVFRGRRHPKKGE